MNNETKQPDYASMWDFHQAQNRSSFLGARTRQRFLARLLKRIGTPEKAKVLEIGFGDGYLLERIAEQGYQAYAADFSAANIPVTERQLAEKGLHAEFCVANINALPYPDKSFDAVIASEVLEHLHDDDLNKGIREVKRVLRPNGKFVITVPYQEDFSVDITTCPHCKSVFHRWGHEQSYDDSKLRSLLREGGFGKINIQGKIFPNATLNIFGKMSYWSQKLMKKYKNYLVVASPSE